MKKVKLLNLIGSILFPNLVHPVYGICDFRAACIVSYLLLIVKKAMIPPLMANLLFRGD